MSEEIKCRFGHTWDGVAPVIDPAKWEDQYPELHGNKCDCGRMVFAERLCTCPLTSKKWEIRLEEAKS